MNLFYLNFLCIEILKIKSNECIFPFSVWLRNLLISAGLEPVLTSQPYWKSCQASYYRQLPTNIKIKILKLSPILLAHRDRRQGLVFHFNIRGKLSIINAINNYYNDVEFISVCPKDLANSYFYRKESTSLWGVRFIMNIYKLYEGKG